VLHEKENNGDVLSSCRCKRVVHQHLILMSSAGV